MSSSIQWEVELAAAAEKHLRDTPKNLADSIRYSLLSPGKRIRPRLTWACAQMLGLSQAVTLPPALALEMIHCFTLIHDDLPCMDDDDYRRGRPSNHKVYGEGLALLAGDALIPLAYDTFFDAAPHADPRHFARALQRFTAAYGPTGVIGGQAAESLLGPDSSFEDLSRMHAMKTGALFVAAILMPMDLAGVDEKSAAGRALSAFAHELGLAFQIADDLEDAAESSGEHEHTSVLRYLSIAEAKSRTLDSLNKATQELPRHWPTASQNLVPLADEVALKIKNAAL